jgi:hypothetical protein
VPWCSSVHPDTAHSASSGTSLVSFPERFDAEYGRSFKGETCSVAFCHLRFCLLVFGLHPLGIT